MNKWIIILCIVMFSANANAKLMFGTGERLSRVQAVDMKGSQGESLYLARILETKSFLLPYSMTDKGYVLAVSGSSEKYYHLPEDRLLKMAQNDGLLPKPLPDWKPSTFDTIYANSLWWGLGVLIVWTLVAKARKRT